MKTCFVIQTPERMYLVSFVKIVRNPENHDNGLSREVPADLRGLIREVKLNWTLNVLRMSPTCIVIFKTVDGAVLQ